MRFIPTETRAPRARILVLRGPHQEIPRRSQRCSATRNNHHHHHYRIRTTTRLASPRLASARARAVGQKQTNHGPNDSAGPGYQVAPSHKLFRLDSGSPAPAPATTPQHPELPRSQVEFKLAQREAGLSSLLPQLHSSWPG